MSATSDSVYRKYDFQWEVLDVIIGGKSLIDTDMGMSGFKIIDSEGADRFMASYGYNMADPIEAE